jgi:UDP-N-acetyl-L-fucosamine synthase
VTIRVLTILGTRPEIIRLSRLIPMLDAHTVHTLVHTGQNYDPNLSDQFFNDLGIRAPDHYLGIAASSVGVFLASLFDATDRLIDEHRPDALVVLGDTNSALAALLAKRRGITVYHLEAGNRCFDEEVPEEINRRVIDHLADFNVVYSEQARRNLLREGIHPRRIYLSGSPLREVIVQNQNRIHESTALSELEVEPFRFFLASVHREENVDIPRRLECLMDAFAEIAERYALPVIVSVHPRTELRLLALNYEQHPAVKLHSPFGYFDYMKLQSAACCVLSDSGTISEEAAIVGFPAVTVRNAMERPEAMDTGTVILTGVDREMISNCVDVAVAQWVSGARPESPPEYRIENFSQRVVDLVIGTTRLSKRWSGVVGRGE